jgi:hypothetical protein
LIPGQGHAGVDAGDEGGQFGLGGRGARRGMGAGGVPPLAPPLGRRAKHAATIPVAPGPSGRRRRRRTRGRWCRPHSRAAQARAARARPPGRAPPARCAWRAATGGARAAVGARAGGVGCPSGAARSKARTGERFLRGAPAARCLPDSCNDAQSSRAGRVKGAGADPNKVAARARGPRRGRPAGCERARAPAADFAHATTGKRT